MNHECLFLLVLHNDARSMRMAARAMARHGLAHAYGHVSVRIDANHFRVSPSRPLGTVGVDAEGIVIALDGILPDHALPESRIHREIYRQRPAVGGICRVQSPAVMALSALGETPRVRHGLGTYFAPSAPLWPGVALVRDDAQAAGVAAQLGVAAAIVLSGNGSVTVADTIEEAVCLAFFLEDAARLELALLPARFAGAGVREYTADEVQARAIRAGGLFERMWHFLCYGDPEWQQQV